MKKGYFLMLFVLGTFSSYAQIESFTNQVDFESAYGGALLVEDFTSAPDEPFICGVMISSTGDDCFEAGALIDGFALTASQNTELVCLPAGFLPSENATPRLGANSGVEYTILSFTEAEGVYAAAFSIHTDNNADFNVRVYDADDNELFNQLMPFTSYVGFVSTSAMARIEIAGVDDGGELIGDLAFGSDNTSSAHGDLSPDVNSFPNPTNGTFSLQAQSQIASIHVYNLVGQKLMALPVYNTSVQMDLGSLPSAIYLADVRFADGRSTQIRLIKQ